MTISIIKLKDNKSNKTLSKNKQEQMTRELLPSIKKVLKKYNVSAEVTVK